MRDGAMRDGARRDGAMRAMGKPLVAQTQGTPLLARTHSSTSTPRFQTLPDCVLARILSTPLAKTEASRSDEDTMLIELTLALLLNLLHTAPPDAPPPTPGASEAASRQDAVVLRQLAHQTADLGAPRGHLCDFALEGGDARCEARNLGLTCGELRRRFVALCLGRRGRVGRWWRIGFPCW